CSKMVCILTTDHRPDSFHRQMPGLGATVFPLLQGALGNLQLQSSLALREIVFLAPIVKAFA
ncbi:MAG: hypothetical protein ABIU29_09010, partial [Chthoniobacterales bacterium]